MKNIFLFCYYNIKIMPKNKGLGGKKFRKSKKTPISDTKELGVKLELKQQNQDYAYVNQLYGNRRVQVLCNDGQLRNAVIPKLFSKKNNKVWIGKGDFVLVSFREFQKEGEIDIIHKY